jgi:hypothetical protein
VRMPSLPLASVIGAACLIVDFSAADVPRDRRPTQEVRIFIPAFAGPGALGLNVATILNLQILTDLRRAPTPNPLGLEFGEGTIIWGTSALPKPTHAAAEQAAEDEEADIVLWGKVYAFGSGAGVQPCLTIAYNNGWRRPRRETWQIDGPLGLSMSIGLPSRRYSFEPIVMTEGMVSSYSMPAALRVYSARDGGTDLGAVGMNTIRALERHDDAIRVVLRTPSQTEGWIRTPGLLVSRSEIVDFASGIVRTMRGDWAGAADLFERTVSDRHVPSALRIDSLLYLGLVAEKQGKSGLPWFQQAEKMDPLSSSVAAYLIMSAFADYTRLPSSAPAASREAASRRLDDLVAAKGHLFERTDPWFSAVRSTQAAMRRPVR